MNGQARNLYWFSNENIQLEVPFFQRPYVWTKEEWTALLESIDNAKNAKMPFIGSFILQETEKKNYYSIIDGQQRITTFSVMIKALLDVFGKKIHEINDVLTTKIRSFIYQDKGKGMASKYEPRMIQSSIDSKDFEAIMTFPTDEKSIEKCNGRIKPAYEYFREVFKNRTDQENSDFVEKIITNEYFFMSINLDREEDDEQKIFDSVNSLGKGLTKGDLIKNFLFSEIKVKGFKENVELDEILKLHKKYWQDVFYKEECESFWEETFTLGRIKTNHIETFFKNFAIIEGIYSPSKTGSLDGLYNAFKKHILKFKTFNELKEYLIKISEYATSYYEYTDNYHNLTDVRMSDTLMSTLLILDQTSTSTFDPYVLYLYKNKPDNYDEQLKALRKFIFKRLLWDGKTKNYNNVCVKLISESDPINYLETYTEDEPLQIKQFPSGLHKTSNAKGRLILFINELIRRDKLINEKVTFEQGIMYNNFTLEHVMPRKWEAYWSDVPCFKITGFDKDRKPIYGEVKDKDDIKEVRDEAITSIGNMTLLTNYMNTKIKNKSIKVKMEGDEHKNQGIMDLTGAIQITKDVTNIYNEQHSWDERDINKRSYKIFYELDGYFNFRDK